MIRLLTAVCLAFAYRRGCVLVFPVKLTVQLPKDPLICSPFLYWLEDIVGILEVNAADVDTDEALSWQAHSARPFMVLCTESYSPAPMSTLKLITHCRYKRRTD